MSGTDLLPVPLLTDMVSIQPQAQGDRPASMVENSDKSSVCMEFAVFHINH